MFSIRLCQKLLTRGAYRSLLVLAQFDGPASEIGAGNVELTGRQTDPRQLASELSRPMTVECAGHLSHSLMIGMHPFLRAVASAWEDRAPKEGL